MSDIRFVFDPEKFVQAVAFFAQGRASELTKLKVAKLLYFADKYHLLKYGRPVLGDAYYCLDHGPVPSASLNLLNEAIVPMAADTKEPLRELLDEYIDVDRQSEYAEFTAKKAPDTSVFSRSELEALQDTLDHYRDYTPWDLRELSHRDPTWTIPDEKRTPGGRADIPYALFFEGQPAEVQELLALIHEEQQERKLAAQLAQ